MPRAARRGARLYKAKPTASTSDTKAIEPVASLLTAPQPLCSEYAIAVAAQDSARGKTGIRNLGSEEETKTHEAKSSQTKKCTRHSLVFRKARRINGARASKSGLKKS